MNYLKNEWDALERYFPSLKAEVENIEFSKREGKDSDVLEVYRKNGGPGLMVSKELGGLGAGPVDAVRVHRALGALSPSLALAATMHDFTVAFLSEYSFYGNATLSYLEAIAKDNLFVSSGFAEGRSGSNILDATMSAKKVDGGYLVNGVKKPCSIAQSMDYITASLKIENADGELDQRCIAIIPAGAKGIETKPFWGINSLAGAQSMEVSLENVFVEDRNLFMPDEKVPLDSVEAGGFLWFELLVTASYLGVVSSLIGDVLSLKRGTDRERMALVSTVETFAKALEGIAYEMQTFESPEDATEDIVAKALLVRYGIQQQIGTLAFQSSELLGGMNFIKNPEIEYSIACCAPLAFHPPSRGSIAVALDSYMMGGSLELA
ncbi:MAG: oxidoreductase [Alteromonadaceae bacterium]|nr:MAG: oxidoreductase [Alteromonadaceae bacterium]